MLAAASLGAVWSSCAPEFGVQSVLDRFGQIAPRILIAVDGYFYKGKTLDRADNIREIASKLPSVQKILLVPYTSASPSLDGLANALLWPRGDRGA